MQYLVDAMICTSQLTMTISPFLPPLQSLPLNTEQCQQLSMIQSLIIISVYLLVPIFVACWFVEMSPTENFFHIIFCLWQYIDYCTGLWLWKCGLN